ncbi:Pepco domain-containing protein [Roseobacteraceae bacterium S113]
MSKIDLLVVDGQVSERGLFSHSTSASPTQIDVDTLKQSWSEICGALKSTFEAAPTIGGFSIGEITISLAVSAEGKFQLIAGASAGVEATVEVKLTKADGS